MDCSGRCEIGSEVGTVLLRPRVPVQQLLGLGDSMVISDSRWKPEAAVTADVTVHVEYLWFSLRLPGHPYSVQILVSHCPSMARGWLSSSTLIHDLIFKNPISRSRTKGSSENLGRPRAGPSPPWSPGFRCLTGPLGRSILTLPLPQFREGEPNAFCGPGGVKGYGAVRSSRRSRTHVPALP